MKTEFWSKCLAAALAVSSGSGVLWAEEPAKAAAPATTSPARDNVAKILELGDPEIAELKKIDFSGVDLDTMDIRTRTMAVMAMNKLLAVHGERATRRIGLLEDFVQYKKLDEEYSKNTEVVPETDRMTFDDGMRLAVVMIRKPEGQDAWSSAVSGANDAMLQKSYSTYIKLARKRWADVQYMRFRVEEIAQFIDSHKMLNEFAIWGRDETAKRKQARADEAAKFRAAQKAEEEKARGERIARYDKERDRRQQIMLKEMEYRQSVDVARASRPTYYYGGGWGDWW